MTTEEKVNLLYTWARVLGVVAAVILFGGGGLYVRLSNKLEALDDKLEVRKTEVESLTREVRALEQKVTAANETLSAIKQTVTAELETASKRLKGASSDAVKEAVGRMQGEANTSIKRVEDVSAKALRMHVEAIERARDTALSSVKNQSEKAMPGFSQKRIAVGKTCARIESLQICWGADKAKPDPNYPHMATFGFVFEWPFARPPAVANGINASGKRGDAFSVSTWRATPSEYTGRLNNMYRGTPIEGTVSMQYVAIGLAK